MREVDDALREDQLLDVWRNHGRTIAAVLGIGLIGLAAWLWYGEREEANAGSPIRPMPSTAAMVRP